MKPKASLLLCICPQLEQFALLPLLATPIFTLLITILKLFSKYHLKCMLIAIITLNFVNTAIKIRTITNLKINNNLIASQPTKQPANQTTRQPPCHKTWCMVLHSKNNHVGFMKLLFWRFLFSVLWCFFISYLSLLNCLQKVRNSLIGVDKLVQKVLINSLCHTKSTVCIIGIIVIAPAVVYAHS